MYRMEKGGAPAPRRAGQDLRRKVDREMHSTLIRATDGMVRQPSDAWYDMRRGRERWWGNLCHRIAELHAKNAPKERVKLIPAVLDAYIDDLYAEEPPRAA